MWAIANFEFKYQLRQPVTPIIFILFFLLTFGAVTIDDVSIGSGGNINVNSPSAIAQTILIMSLFGMIIPTVLLSNVVLRDRDLKMDGLIYSLPITPAQYLIGRFLGAFPVALLTFSAVPAGMLIGSFMPWLDPETVGPTKLSYYLQPFLAFGALNMLVTGMIFFTVANLTRSIAMTYASLVAFLVIYFVGISLLQDPSYLETLALIDPFGLFGFFETTRYWTAFESNSQLIPLEGNVLFNRLIWLGVALAGLALNVLLFSFTAKDKAGRKARRRAQEAAAAPGDDIRVIALPKATPVFTGGTAWAQFAARTRFEVFGVVRTIAFWVLLALGMFNTLGGLLNTGTTYGTSSYPLTRVLIETIQGSFGLIPFVVVIYYAAELIWRERQHKIHEIIDAAPAPNWVIVFSKFLALALVIALLMAVAIVTGMAVQLFSGYTELEAGLYLRRLYLFFALPILMLGALSMFVQAISVNRYLGMLIMLLVIIGQITLTNIGFEHNLYQFGGAPATPLSDMNGGGHFEGIAAWFLLYWGFFSTLLIIATYLIWVRGAAASLPRRIRLMPSNLGPVTGAAAALSLAGFIGTGAWIYYNTNVLNTYETAQDRENRSVLFEESWRQYEDLDQPFLTAVKADVDLYPYDRRFTAKGTYTLTNSWDTAIDTLHVDLNYGIDVHDLQVEGGRLETEDEPLNHYVFTLDPPLAAGESRTLTFDTEVDFKGFRNSNNGTRIVWNGSFINNTEIMPSLGVSRGKMLLDRNERRKRGLEPIDRSPKLEDESQYYYNALNKFGNWVDFDVTVSTAEDQIAIAPGYIQREWVENGRRYFNYKMDEPILSFFSFQSAEYTVAEDQWNDVDLQVFYHQPHNWNVERMMKGMKDSLDYFTEHFGPFQFGQLRILEFPAYASFAQSFANTVPYSESIGFVADLRDPENLDYVYYVTAHEVAHQWWAHQVLSAPVQGGTLLAETLSQYSAIMVMEQEYGEHQIRRFLRYELDSYLSARGSEAREELPLYRVENQGYIHYRKGSIAMYALKDYVGEAVVNTVLRRMIDDYKYVGTPYPTTLDFMRILREEAGPEHEELIQDLFEKIVLWDLALDEVAVTERSDGRFDVEMTVTARKLEADGEGRETERDLDMPIDIGLFTEHPDDVYEGDDHVILLEKRQIVSGENTLTFTVDTKPEVAGIDPYVKLIDRRTDDNLQRVGAAEKAAG